MFNRKLKARIKSLEDYIVKLNKQVNESNEAQKKVNDRIQKVVFNNVKHINELLKDK